MGTHQIVIALEIYSVLLRIASQNVYLPPAVSQPFAVQHLLSSCGCTGNAEGAKCEVSALHHSLQCEAMNKMKKKTHNGFMVAHPRKA